MESARLTDLEVKRSRWEQAALVWDWAVWRAGHIPAYIRVYQCRGHNRGQPDKERKKNELGPVGEPRISVLCHRGHLATTPRRGEAQSKVMLPGVPGPVLSSEDGGRLAPRSPAEATEAAREPMQGDRPTQAVQKP